MIIVGALPPPIQGMTVFNQMLLSSKVVREFRVHHLDTSDRRTLDNLGRLDIVNAIIGLKNCLQLVLLCLRTTPHAVYIPNAQNNWGFFRDGIFILLAKVFSRAKIIMHYHGGESFLDFWRTTNWFMQRFIRFVLTKVDLAIVVGEGLKWIFDGAVRRTESVPNGIHVDLDTAQRPDDAGTVTVAYLGTLMRAKGVIDLLNAAGHVVKKYPNTKFRFAGDWWQQEPELQDEVKQIAAEHRLQQSVEFVGRVEGDAKRRFFLQTSIFVFPTWSDSFGLVNLEAMAAGCPVISTRGVGAIAEVVSDGVTGMLVEKQNPQQLADAIIRLIENPELRRTMGEAGRKRYLEFFTFEKCADRMIEVFRSALVQKDVSIAATQPNTMNRKFVEREVA